MSEAISGVYQRAVKRASYGPTSTGVNIASNTLTCFSARLGLLPPVVRTDWDFCIELTIC